MSLTGQRDNENGSQFSNEEREDMFARNTSRARFGEGAGGALGARSPSGGLAPATADLEQQGDPPVAGSWARGPVAPDPRKFNYDTFRARSTHVNFGVTRDDRMSAEEAGQFLHEIHVMFGLDRTSEARIAAFDDALFFCHTVNSGSTLQPGATKLSVDGATFDYGDVVKKLGTNIRRFFRAYADDIVDVNRRVLRKYDPYDPVSVEHVGWLNQVAIERGLQRYPHLAHDSADACVKLTPAERAAVIASKREVLSSTINAADSMLANPRVVNANRYDSTNRTTI